MKGRKCEGCPILITTEKGAEVDNYGCLPSPVEAVTWYKTTGRLWACHERPEKPCVGLLIRLKKMGLKADTSRPLITEKTTLEEIKNSLLTPMAKNNDPFQPWNDPMYKNDPFAPHNGFDKDNPFKPWNSPFGRKEDLDGHERSYYR